MHRLTLALILGLATLAFTSALAPVARAANLTVQPACGGAPSCFTTIQGAVNAAATGDTISIAAGVYREHVSIPGSGAATNLTLSGSTGSVFVDGGGTDRVFNIADNTTVTMTSFAVVNGSAIGVKASGGGILVGKGATLTLNSMVIAGNKAPADGRGGGIALLDNSTLTVNGQTAIADNVAGEGGGIASAGASPPAAVTLNGGLITGNSATDSDTGGIGISGGALTLNNTIVSGNKSKDGGSGIFIGTAVTFTMTGGYIIGNISERGAAALLTFEGPSTLNGVTVVGNSGVGISTFGPMTLTNSTVTRNVSPNADVVAGVETGGPNGTATLNNTTVSGNVPKNCGGKTPITTPGCGAP